MLVELMLHQKPQPRKIGEVEMSSPPGPEDTLTDGGRAYRVVQRAWVTEITSLVGERIKTARCSVLLVQIAGPPHVFTPGLEMP